MKTITFTSHYNDIELNLRLTDEKADMFLNNKYYSAIELYFLDHDRVSEGAEPKILSRAQVFKLDNNLPGIDYWDNVECRD